MIAATHAAATHAAATAGPRADRMDVTRIRRVLRDPADTVRRLGLAVQGSAAGGGVSTTCPSHASGDQRLEVFADPSSGELRVACTGGCTRGRPAHRCDVLLLVALARRIDPGDFRRAITVAGQIAREVEQDEGRRAQIRGDGSEPRQMLADAVAERSALGALLSDSRRVAEILAGEPPLLGRDFHHPVYGLIWDAAHEVARARAAAGEAVDVAAVVSRLRARDELWRLRAVAGAEGDGAALAYLGTIMSESITVETVRRDVRAIRHWARLRRHVEYLSGVVDGARSTDVPDQYLAESLVGLRDLDGPEIPAARLDVFPTVLVGAVADPGPPRWVVEDLWTEAAFGFVGGEPKALKSWLAMYLGICIASGRPAFGRWPVQQGPVLCFNAEGGVRLLRRRLDLLCEGMGIPLAELPFHAIDLPVLDLGEAAQLAQLRRTAEAIRPKLLLLDPLRELHRGDENDSAFIAQLLGPIRTLQVELDVAAMLIHHMSKSGGKDKPVRGGQRLRGSGALHGASDSALYLDVHGEGRDKIMSVVAEHRGAASPDSFSFRLVGERREGAKFDHSVRLEIVDEAGVREPNDDERVFNVIRGAGAGGINVRSLRNALKGKAGMSHKRVDAAVKSLVEDGSVVAETVGVNKMLRAAVVVG